MPLNLDNVQVEDATEEEIRALPSKRGSDPRLVAIITDVAAGKRKKLTVDDPRTLKGIRVASGVSPGNAGCGWSTKSSGPRSTFGRATSWLAGNRR